MVQNYLVVDSHRHQMMNSLGYMVYVVYFYSVEKMGNFHYYPVEGVDSLENLLNWSMYLENSNSENILDLNFVYFWGGVDLFLIGVLNYNSVLQRCFLGTFFVFLTVLSLVCTSDSPYVNILEQPKV